MKRAVASFSVNPNTSTVVGSAWTAYHTALGITDVRVPVTTSGVGDLPTNLYRRAADVYRAAGIRCLAQITRAFQPVGGEGPGIFPNAPLNGSGDRLNSDYIDRWTLRAEGFFRQLVPHGWTDVLVWNEPNTRALLAPGIDADATSLKPGAMHPSVYAATARQAGERLHSIGVTGVWLGPLSVLPHLTGLDAGNPFYARWLTTFYETLAAHGQHGPYPWSGWALNSEGVWSDATFGAAVAVLRGIMDKHGDTGKILCTEWGERNTFLHSLDAVLLLAQTGRAIAAHTDGPAYVFSGSGSIPYLDDPSAFPEYGMFGYREANGLFLPGPPYPMQAGIINAWQPVTP